MNKLNKTVFGSASCIILLILSVTALNPKSADTVFKSVQTGLVDNGSWFYVLSVAVILIFVIYLAISEYGTIKLGEDHSTPDYSLTSWLAMLFAAGMGIGLMFFGVAEPLMHFLAPPTAEPQSLDAVEEAMKITFFHWGIHAWAIYTVVALI
ncbi:MAG: choline transporter, partial [Enterobacterales bacterium]|nr:choline transporter [Enterobacterales bacterium]